MEQYEIDEQNRELMEKFLERIPKDELITGMVTDNPEGTAVVWYPVDQKRSQELLRKLADLIPRIRGVWRNG